MKVAGKSGSVRVRLVPAPRGAAVVGSPAVRDFKDTVYPFFESL